MRVGIKTIWLAVAVVTLWWGGAIRGAWGQNAPAAAPPIHAFAAIVIDGNTGATLWAKNPDKRLSPASTTKIATGLLLARDLPPDQPIVASPNAAHTPGHALGMQAGEKFAARDLLPAVLLASANDASVAAAEQMAGSEPAFAARMTEWARANGAPNTRFANASGLPDVQHYATARDLAALARAALQNPAFACAVQTRTYLLPRSGGRAATLLTNENALLWTVPGMDGVKAGWTQEAGACFVGSATRHGQRIITVVLNSPDWKGETAALVEYGFAHVREERGREREGESASGRPEEKTALDAAPSAHAAPASAVPANTEVNRQPNVAAPSNIPGKRASTAHPADMRQPASSGVASAGNDLPPASMPDAARTADKVETAPVPEEQAGGIPQASRSAPPNTSRMEKQSPRLPDTSASPLPPATLSWPDLHLPAPTGHLSPSAAVPAAHAAAAPPATRARPPVAAFLAAPPPTHSFASRFDAVGGLPAFCLYGLLLAASLLMWRKGVFAMPDFLSGLFGKRRRGEPSPASDLASRAAVPASLPVVKPQFSFKASPLERQDGRTWLNTLLETPARLLEPAARRQAAAIRNADPLACDAKVQALLFAPNPRTRIAGAELTGAHTPRQAEETLLHLLKDEHVSADTRAEALSLLADLSGDRHERVWLQMLLRDGSAPAAYALARQPQLEEATCQALQHVVSPGNETREDGGDLKRLLRNAHIAGALLAQGKMTRLEAAPHFDALPSSHGEPILTASLRGSQNPEAVECLVDIVIHGHAYPALQSLLETDPRLIRAALDPLLPKLDRAQQTRALILKWLTLGEGNTNTVQELALAGNDLARGALQLGRLHRWEPSTVAPDALLAAAQIYSLRLGFSRHTQNDIALAFRKAATDGEAQSLAALPPTLQPLAQAYAHPEVYEAVQSAMHTGDGLPALLAVLARQPGNPQYRQEIAFWCDKMPLSARLSLTQALCAGVDTNDSDCCDVIADRACDPDVQVRNAALRWLHSHPETEQEKHEDYPHTDSACPAALAVREDGNG